MLRDRVISASAEPKFSIKYRPPFSSADLNQHVSNILGHQLNRTFAVVIYLEKKQRPPGLAAIHEMFVPLSSPAENLYRIASAKIVADLA